MKRSLVFEAEFIEIIGPVSPAAFRIRLPPCRPHPAGYTLTSYGDLTHFVNYTVAAYTNLY